MSKYEEKENEYRRKSYYAGLDLLSSGQKRLDVLVGEEFADPRAWILFILIGMAIFPLTPALQIPFVAAGAAFLMYVTLGSVYAARKIWKLRPFVERHVGASGHLTAAINIVTKFTHLVGKSADELLCMSLADTMALVDERLSCEAGALAGQAEHTVSPSWLGTPNLMILEDELESALRDKYNTAAFLGLTKRPFEYYWEKKLRSILRGFADAERALRERPKSSTKLLCA